MSNIYKKLFLLIGLVGFGVASRIGWVVPNWALIGALALWSPYFFNRTSLSLGFILSILVLSDLVLGFYPEQMWVYLAYVPYVLLGAKEYQTQLYRPLLGSLGFFVISNFGVWISTDFYLKSFEGLYQCYLMGLPFLKATLLSDGLYFYGIAGIIYGLKKGLNALNVNPTYFRR